MFESNILMNNDIKNKNEADITIQVSMYIIKTK